jgi:hypothetical protein
MEQLKNQIEQLINSSNYETATNLVSKELNIKLKVISSHYGKHFHDDKQNRYIFKIQLLKGKKSYTFNFGQSINAGNKAPSMYDILSCLQKYDVGSFENFCGDFGYNTDSRTAERTYKAVLKEFNSMERLFNNDELEVLQQIN